MFLPQKELFAKELGFCLDIFAPTVRGCTWVKSGACQSCLHSQAFCFVFLSLLFHENKNCLCLFSYRNPGPVSRISFLALFCRLSVSLCVDTFGQSKNCRDKIQSILRSFPRLPRFSALAPAPILMYIQIYVEPTEMGFGDNNKALCSP